MRFTIKTIGCKVNTYESNIIKAELINAGLVFIDVKNKEEYKNLDYYIINTCSVTSVADKKSRQMIHSAKKLNRKMKIIATGCYNPMGTNVISKNEVSKELNGDSNNIIDLYIPNSEKQNFAKIFLAKFCKSKNENVLNIKFFENNDSILSSNYSDKKIFHVREFIKIQDGCNQYCTYCIIPFLRGNIKSRDDDVIISEITEKVKNGVKEIVLTGIHISSFGLDRVNITYESEGAIDIARDSLLSIINKVADIKVDDKEVSRIRLGSLEPRIINDAFLKGIIDGPAKDKFCSNFCLSLQSGCDKTLKAMNRHYTTADFSYACEIIRKYIPYATITTDVIVGFPGESVFDYEESLTFVKKMRFYNPNIFPYSKRKGTKAALYDNQVIKEEKHRRAAKMIDECEKITKEIEKEHDNLDEDILVEQETIKNGIKYKVGYTKTYIKKYIKI